MGVNQDSRIQPGLWVTHFSLCVPYLELGIPFHHICPDLLWLKVEYYEKNSNKHFWKGYWFFCGNHLWYQCLQLFDEGSLFLSYKVGRRNQFISCSYQFFSVSLFQFYNIVVISIVICRLINCSIWISYHLFRNTTFEYKILHKSFSFWAWVTWTSSIRNNDTSW